MSAKPAPQRLGTAARLVVGVVVGLAAAFGVSLAVHHRSSGGAAVTDGSGTRIFQLADMGPAPALKGFTDQSGQPFDPSSLAGKVQVVSFLDPRGTRASPVIAVNLLMALKSDLQVTKQFGKDVAFVSIDVNPQPGGPEPTAAFMKRVVGFGKAPAPVNDWPFLSAPWPTVEKVVRKGYGVPVRRLGPTAFASYAEKQKADGTFFYARAWNPLASKTAPKVVGAADIVIVGPKGHIRARIPRAYQVSNVAVENAVSRVLAGAGG